MNIHCPTCGSEVDLYELHCQPEMTYVQARKAFFEGKDGKVGCAALGMTHHDRPDLMRAMASDALYDLLGDDVDGTAAMMEDATLEGMFD